MDEGQHMPIFPYYALKRYSLSLSTHGSGDRIPPGSPRINNYYFCTGTGGGLMKVKSWKDPKQERFLIAMYLHRSSED